MLRAKATGDVQDAPRQGRPSKGLQSDTAMALLKQGIAEGKGCPQLATDLDEHSGISVSSETVRRHLKQRLGRPLRPVKKPRLSSHHMQARLAFAKEWARRAWDKVVVTDSKDFWLCPSGVGRKVWRVLYGEHAPVVATNINCTKVHVYGGVSKWGRTPLFTTVGTTGLKCDTKGVTAKVYTQLLEDNLIPACKVIMGSRYGSQWIFE